MALRRHGNEAWQLHRINGALWIITLRAGQGWTQNALSLILLLLTRSYEIFDITPYVIIMSTQWQTCALVIQKLGDRTRSDTVLVLFSTTPSAHDEGIDRTLCTCARELFVHVTMVA